MASRSTGMRAGMGWRRQWFLLLAVVAWMMLVNGVNGEGRRGRKVSHQDEDDDDTAHVCDGNKRRISRDKVRPFGVGLLWCPPEELTLSHPPYLCVSYPPGQRRLL